MLRPIICTAIAVGLAGPAFGAIINVGPGQSVQAAINIASDSDIIVVAPGTYFETINLSGKAITVRSSGGPDVTTLDGTGIQASVVLLMSGEGPDTVVEGFTITGGTGTPGSYRMGGGLRMMGVSAVVRGCFFVDNHADEGGAAHIVGGTPTVTDCRFVGNSHSAPGQGGGAIFTASSFLKLVNCSFVDNVAAVLGGALYDVSGFPTIINCEFYNNAGLFGGGIYSAQGFPTLINCTISGNTSVGAGGGIRTNANTATLYNCIIWGNSPDEIYDSSNSVSTLYNCNVMGGWSGAGSNNINVQPGFVDALNGDYRLAPGSPCIDQGDSSALPAEIMTDLDGNERFVGQVDLGPYETQGSGSPCPHDLNGDGEVGIEDLLALLAAWGSNPVGPPDFDGDGIVGINDFLEILAVWGGCP